MSEPNNTFSSILMHTIHLLHFMVLVQVWMRLYMNSWFLFVNKVQYAIEMELFPWQAMKWVTSKTFSSYWLKGDNGDNDQPFT
jgi:hypothetical protein